MKTTSAIGYAAAELQRFLRAISGATLEIAAEREAGSGPAFLLGPSRRVQKTGLLAKAKKFTGDGILIKSVGRVEKLLLPLWYMQLGWPDRYGLSKDRGPELLADFRKVVQAFHITNESEGPVGNMDRFLADMEARYGK